MSGADEARDALRASTIYRPVYDAGRTYSTAHQALVHATELEGALARAVELIIAIEGLKDAATEAEKVMRVALATALQDTGAPEAVTMHHKAYLARKAAFVSVDQPDLVPEGYWNKPTPDKASIKKAIESGEDIPGCSLVRPNDSSLVIRSRK